MIKWHFKAVEKDGLFNKHGQVDFNKQVDFWVH